MSDAAKMGRRFKLELETWAGKWMEPLDTPEHAKIVSTLWASGMSVQRLRAGDYVTVENNGTRVRARFVRIR